MSGQSVKITLKSSASKPYSSRDLIKTIRLDNQWFVAGFSLATDRVDGDPNSCATLYRELAAAVTLDQFCEQTGIDKEIVLSFDVV